MQKKILTIVLFVVVSALGEGYAASFRGLGAAEDGSKSIANDISADGTTVVGNGRWTVATGWKDVGGIAHSVSADGSVVVGNRQYEMMDPAGWISDEAFIWTEGNGTEYLGFLPGDNHSIAHGVSDDGSTVVGECSFLGHLVSWHREAFVYTTETGMLQLEHVTDDSFFSCAKAVSADGSVIAGYSTPPDSFIGKTTRWAGDGVENLMESDRWLLNFSSAEDVSSDGLTIVGYHAGESYVWKEGGSMIALGKLPGSYESRAYSVSATGDCVVGASYGAEDGSAFFWSEDLGMVDLKGLLESSFHLDLTGWLLTNATGISANGTVMVGNGINPSGVEEAWMATIPEPATIILLALGGLALRRRQDA